MLRVSNSTAPDFDLRTVEDGLAGTMFAGRLHGFATVASTQELALSAAQNGAEAGHVYVAGEQTAGRGRGGHAWHSEAGTGLYLSALVRPALSASNVLLLSLAAGLAAQAAIREVHGMQIDLRWPNDLVTLETPSRKLGGILTESSMLPDGSVRFAVIGIGINVNQAAMPDTLQETSTSLRLLLGHETARDSLLLALLRHLEVEVQTLELCHTDTLQHFEAASTWVRGKRVHVAEAEGYTGTTGGMEPNGLLRVCTDDGACRTVLHGGVRELL